jgi:hypothetical protein
MSRLYGPVHRSLQERFDTRRLADNVEKRVVLTEIPPDRTYERRLATRAGAPGLAQRRGVDRDLSAQPGVSRLSNRIDGRYVAYGTTLGAVAGN